MKVTIQFRCLFRRTPLGKSSPIKMFTQHRHNIDISVHDVPEEKWSKEHKDSDVLFQAEQALIQKISNEHPGYDLLGWDAYGSEEELFEFLHRYPSERQPVNLAPIDGIDTTHSAAYRLPN